MVLTAFTLLNWPAQLLYSKNCSTSRNWWARGRPQQRQVWPQGTSSCPWYIKSFENSFYFETTEIDFMKTNERSLAYIIWVCLKRKNKQSRNHKKITCTAISSRHSNCTGHAWAVRWTEVHWQQTAGKFLQYRKPVFLCGFQSTHFVIHLGWICS